MVHIHNKKCPICGFEFENRVKDGDDDDDYLSFERSTGRGRKGADDDGPYDKKTVKKGFFKVNLDS